MYNIVEQAQVSMYCGLIHIKSRAGAKEPICGSHLGVALRLASLEFQYQLPTTPLCTVACMVSTTGQLPTPSWCPLQEWAAVLVFFFKTISLLVLYAGILCFCSAKVKVLHYCRMQDMIWPPFLHTCFIWKNFFTLTCVCVGILGLDHLCVCRYIGVRS